MKNVCYLRAGSSGVGLQLTREAAHVSRCSFYQRKRGKGTRGETPLQLSPLNILSRPAHSARTHAIYQETQTDACNPPSFLRDELATHGCSYFKVHDGFTCKNDVSASVTQHHYSPILGGKCSPLHTNALKNPHGLNLRSDTVLVSCTKAKQATLAHPGIRRRFPIHFAVRLRRAGGATKVSASVSLCKHEPPPRVHHGRTRRPKYVMKTHVQGRPGIVRPPRPPSQPGLLKFALVEHAE